MQYVVWHYQLLSRWTGGTKFVFEVARRMSAKYHVIILCNSISPEVANSFKAANITILLTYPWPKNSLLHWLFLPVGLLIDIFRSWPYFSRADYILATAFPSNVVCAIYCRLYHKRFYYYCYEPFGVFFNATLRKQLGAWLKLQYVVLTILYKKLDIWATHQADKVFSLTAITAKEIEKAYALTSIITGAGVDTHQFRHYQQNHFLTRYRGRKIIAHSTDYTIIKQTDLAIRALQRAVASHPEVVLLITSTNESISDRQKYVELATELRVTKNVQFLGLLPRDELPLFYSAACMYLSTTYDISHGAASTNLPVKEALACETPAIRAAVTTDDVEDGISGFLVDSKDSNLVADRIEFLLDNPGRAKQMGKRGRLKMIAMYDWDKVTTLIVSAMTESL